MEFIFFILAIVVCFYLPGKFLLTKLKLTLDSPEDLFLPFVLGIILFALVSYIFSWLKLEFIILPLFLTISFFTFKSKKWFAKSIAKTHHWPLLVVVILSIVFSLSMLTTGVHGDSILYRRDDLWHLSLINELRFNFPPDNPGFAGIPLRGYHFFYDFLLAKIVNIFSISPFSLYFHLFPLFIAILWGLGVYALMYVWSKRASIAVWAVFLTQFGGSFAFILRLRGHEGLSLDSAFGIQQSATALLNPSFSISIVILIAVLLSIYKYLSSRKNEWLIPIVLCVGLVTMFKVYAGIILLGGFMFFTLIQLLRRKYILLIACFFIGILFFSTYWVLADHQSKLIFAPLWAPHKVLIDNMPWYRYDEKIYTFTKFSVIKGIVETELYSLYVFFFGNLGTRLIGTLFLPFLFLQKFKKPSFFAFIVLVMSLISILIPLFFIQSGQVFETIQMVWYFLFLVSLFAAFGFYKLFSFSLNKALKILLFIIIIILTLPSAYENYKTFFASLDSSKLSLSSPYFDAMQFLKSKGNYNQTVLEIPSKATQSTQPGVMAWYSKSSSPAIVAFSNKRSYLSNEYLGFTGVSIMPRIDFINKIILLNNLYINKSSEYISLRKEVEQGLNASKISFIYSPYPLLFLEDINSISKIYENPVASIYRVEYKNY